MNNLINNLHIKNSPRETNQINSPNRLKENFIKSAFKKTEIKKHNTQRASSASCKQRNLRGYLNSKIDNKSNRKRPETSESSRRVRFAGKNNISTPNVLDDSRIRNLSRDQITPLARHSKEAEKLIVQAKNKNWDTEKIEKRSTRPILSINDSLLEPPKKEGYKSLSSNSPAISKPLTDTNLGVTKYSKKLDSKSTMNS